MLSIWFDYGSPLAGHGQLYSGGLLLAFGLILFFRRLLQRNRPGRTEW